MLYALDYLSPLGMITLVSDETHLIGAWLESQKYFAATLTEVPQQSPVHPVLHMAAQWLDRYFAGQKPDPRSLPLRPGGSPFRQQVYNVLLSIPYGETMTYGEIAKKLAAKNATSSARAVGGAVAHNPISIIIPCHRVIGSGGKLTGYAGGLDRKIALLRHEGVTFV